MNLHTETMPHQRAAVDKLLPIKVGALFMEMGTGKSRTAIEMVARREHKISRVLWFCPVSLKQTIASEINRHVHEASVHVFDHKTRMAAIPEAYWYVVGIETMSASRRVILAVNALVDDRTMVIVDESQYIKGHRAARTDWITRIGETARYRLILTGTPITQGVQDLFAQMRFLSHKILGYRSFYSFANNHLEYSDKYPGLIVRAHNTQVLADKVQPYVYQVTKAECLDLPDKLYERRYFQMTDPQRWAYEDAKEEILATLDPDDFTSYTIFQLFTALQQVVSGYRNKKGDITELPHRRPDVLERIINEIPADEKIIIWAKYHYDIRQIMDVLKPFGPAVEFHGGLTERQRNESVRLFRDSARFLVATPSAGGHGLTLNEAAHVIFYNNGFKYSERVQAEDRCHRIGQDRPVTYIDLVCVQSIDDRIMRALDAKGNTVQAFKREIDKVKNKKALRKMIREL